MFFLQNNFYDVSQKKPQEALGGGFLFWAYFGSSKTTQGDLDGIRKAAAESGKGKRRKAWESGWKARRFPSVFYSKNGCF